MMKLFTVAMSLVIAFSGVTITISPVELGVGVFTEIEYRVGADCHGDEIVYVASSTGDSDKVYAVTSYNTKTGEKEIIYEPDIFVTHPQLNEYKAIWYEWNEQKNHTELILFDRPSGEKISLNVDCSNLLNPTLLQAKVVWLESNPDFEDAETLRLKFFDSVYGGIKSISDGECDEVFASDQFVFWVENSNIFSHEFESGEMKEFEVGVQPEKIIGLSGENLIYKDFDGLHMVNHKTGEVVDLDVSGRYVHSVNLLENKVFYLSSVVVRDPETHIKNYSDSQIKTISILDDGVEKSTIVVGADHKMDLMTDGEFLVWNDVLDSENSKLMGHHLDSGETFLVTDEHTEDIPFLLYDGILPVYSNDPEYENSVTCLRLSAGK